MSRSVDQRSPKDERRERNLDIPYVSVSRGKITEIIEV